MKKRKTERLFLALFLRLLKPDGRAAVIVPDGVLFGSSNAHKTLRKIIVEDHKLDAVISLPGGVFKPYAGVSTAILLFTKTNSGGPVPEIALTEDEHAKNNLPDLLTRWRSLPAVAAGSRPHRGQLQRPARPRTAQSFCVPKADLAAQGYDLSLNRYKQVVHEEVTHRPPGELLKSLAELEKEITTGMKELKERLKRRMSFHSHAYHRIGKRRNWVMWSSSLVVRSHQRKHFKANLSKAA